MDGMGRGFVEPTRTLVLSRHGAKILLKRLLVPHQEVSIRCFETRKETDARIVGQIGKSSEGNFYGVEFLDPNVNVWDIEFPPLSESEKAVARVLLECVRCHTRELTYLNEFEAEVFEANRCLSRSCKRCTDTSVWKQSGAQPSAEQIALPVPASASPAPPAATPVRSQNERKEVRVGIEMTACLRHPQLGEEVIATENVSRSGFAFKSPKYYGANAVVEVAIPYSRGAGNIFTPARIEHIEELPAEGLTRYGVSYIRVHKGWPGT